MSYELRAEELAAQEVLALPERELLQPTNTVSPAQLALALNLADITTGDVGGCGRRSGQRCGGVPKH